MPQASRFVRGLTVAESIAVTLDPLPPDRNALLWLLAGATSAMVPHILELPFIVFIAFYIAAGWRYAIEFHHWRRPSRLLLVALTILVVIITWRHYRTIAGREPGTALLIVLLGLKFLEIKTARDYALTLFLCFIVILASFLHNQTLALGIYAAGVVYLAVVILIRFNQPNNLAARERLRLAAVLYAQALPVMLVIYVLFPRLEGALWATPPDPSAGRTGMPETVRPGDISELTLSYNVAFRATFDAAPPPAAALYWRGRVLWNSDGRAWSADPPVTSHVVAMPLSPPVRYQITLEPTDQPWLYALDVPIAGPPDSRITRDLMLERAQPVRERLIYAATSALRLRAGTLDSNERARALALSNISGRTRALAERWRTQAADAGAIVRLALDHFRAENFYYTLTPPVLRGDPVDGFLFDTRRGFCEHYAAAFVTLMRAAGVPSRMVVGYQGGEYNPTGNYLIVRQYDAHAWAEVWHEGSGWLRVDPTAAVAPERVELGLDAIRRLQAQGAPLGRLTPDAMRRAIALPWLAHAWRKTRLAWDYANFSWYRWVADYSLDRQRQLLEQWGIAESAMILMAGLVLVLLLGYAVLTARARPRLDPAVAAYQKFCRKLARVGLIRAPHEGAGSFAERVVAQRPDLKQIIDSITEQYHRLRYGRFVAADDTKRLKHLVTNFKP